MNYDQFLRPLKLSKSRNVCVAKQEGLLKNEGTAEVAYASKYAWVVTTIQHRALLYSFKWMRWIAGCYCACLLIDPANLFNCSISVLCF